jgi:hypothetical protein
MAIKTLSGLVLCLLLSSNVMAQSSSGSQSAGGGAQGARSFDVRRDSQRVRDIPRARPAAPAVSVQSVPELDGNMAFLALGLTFAVGCLVREKRRTS